MSKGSKPRPYDPKAYAAGYDRIFGKKAESPRDKSDPEFVTEWSCPRCGSTEDPWFSRTEPMGYVCHGCGEMIDGSQELESDRELRIEAEMNTILTEHGIKALLGILGTTNDSGVYRAAKKALDQFKKKHSETIPLDTGTPPPQ